VGVLDRIKEGEDPSFISQPLQPACWQLPENFRSFREALASLILVAETQCHILP